MRDWTVWLKEQFDQAEAQGREHLQCELACVAPDRLDRGEDKWQIVIRLCSPAQSIRSRAIKSWKRPTWIKLSAVHNDKQAVDVEFTFGAIMPMQELGLAGYRAARLFVAAMIMGSTGFWWWQRPDQTGRFYQRLTDLTAAAGMKLDLDMYAGPEFEWKRDAIKEDQLTRIAVCLGMASRLENPVYYAVIETYITGLALFVKAISILVSHRRPASGSPHASAEPCAISMIGTERTRNCPLPSPSASPSNSQRMGRNC
jgi:hypothetical protein